MYPFFEDNRGPHVAGVPRKGEADHRRQKVLPEPEDEFQTKGETTPAQHSARPSQQDGFEGNRRRGFPPWEERENENDSALRQRMGVIALIVIVRHDDDNWWYCFYRYYH